MSEQPRPYVLITRDCLDHPRFKPRGKFSPFEAWCWLITHAAYSDYEVPVVHSNNRRVVITLKPGQVAASVRYLMKAWGWGNERVQLFLNTLASDGSIDTQTDTGQTVITICNWDKFQRPFQEAGTQTDTETSTQTGTQTGTKEKEDKKGKEKTVARKRAEGSSGFEEWYAIYPKKKAPKSAQRAYSKIIAAGEITHEELLVKTRAHAAFWATKPKGEIKYCPYPATWLNSGEFLDAPESAPSTGSFQSPALKDPRDFSPTVWAGVMSHYRTKNVWFREQWGPAPGEDGCLVPIELRSTSPPPSSGEQQVLN